MKLINDKWLEKVKVPSKDSHKGENGKLMIVGGSRLFHGASLWALKTATRIVDMVFYSSVPENERLLDKLKAEVFDFIAVPRERMAEYGREAEVILIGPGMTRAVVEPAEERDFTDTKQVMKYLVGLFPEKKWVVDAGALQVMEVEWLKQLSQAVITPHLGEFGNLVERSRLGREEKRLARQMVRDRRLETVERLAKKFSRMYSVVVVVKGVKDVVSDGEEVWLNQTGNVGMTKGGSGDVLAGVIAALYCKNDGVIAAGAGVYLLGLAGDKLSEKVGAYYNSTDLMNALPGVMGEKLWHGGNVQKGLNKKE